jgi:hypothetical protein
MAEGKCKEARYWEPYWKVVGSQDKLDNGLPSNLEYEGHCLHFDGSGPSIIGPDYNNYCCCKCGSIYNITRGCGANLDIPIFNPCRESVEK